MPQRPRLSDETLARVNDEADDILRVDPQQVPIDERISALLDELDKERSRADRARRQANNAPTGTTSRY